MTNQLQSKSSTPKQSLTRRLYEQRKIALTMVKLRSLPVMVVSGIFVSTLVTIILSLTWIQQSEIEYLRGSSVVQILDHQKWEAILPGHEPQEMDFLDLANVSVSELQGAPYELRTKVPTSIVQSVQPSNPEESIVLSMPSFMFREADVETSWARSRHFMDGEHLSLAFRPVIDTNPLQSQSDTQWISIRITPKASQKTILQSAVNQTPMFFAGQIRYQKFQDFLAGRRVGSGKQLADIGRVVIALFSVLLFVFIDSSAECLALGIFMSLKAFGLAAAQRWIPETMMPAWMIGTLPPMLLGFADFMQLYFFTQLARLFKPRPMIWLASGLLFGIVYAYGATIPTSDGGINWGREVWRYRNLFFGFGCLACSIPVSVICFKDKNYHRTAALIIASFGVISQVVVPIIIDIQGISDALWYKTWYSLIETQTPYVFALSTFINVSTLEKRVKTLTDSAVRSNIIEQEMALGKSVQDTLFKIPAMPEGIKVAISHHAEMYVSGDMIFSNHDPKNHTATALLCDVTGHGVQAALKASICSAICDAVWDVNDFRSNDSPSDRLQILHKRATRFLCKASSEPELLAVVGCEISLGTKRTAHFYRANAVFPLIVAKTDRGAWEAKLVISPNLEMHSVPLDGLSFIVMFSDGFIDSSRTYKHFTKWLTSQLSSNTDLTAESLKAMILAYTDWHETHDDQTLCVMEVA